MNNRNHDKSFSNVTRCPRCGRPIAARNSDKLQVLKCPGCGSTILHPPMPL